jgi:hypothetical protein
MGDRSYIVVFSMSIADRLGINLSWQGVSFARFRPLEVGVVGVEEVDRELEITLFVGVWLARAFLFQRGTTDVRTTGFAVLSMMASICTSSF